METQSISGISRENLFNGLFTLSLSNQTPVAIYRLPEGDNEIFFISGTESNLQIPLSAIEKSSAGFIISPFSDLQNHSFIKAEFSGKITETKTEIFSTQNSLSVENILSNNKFSLPELPEKIRSLQNRGKEDYELLVEKGLSEIQEGNLKKIVTARSKFIKSTDINPIEIFLKLIKKFPSSYISLCYHPKWGVWLGASPELLASLSSNQIFNTVALAGTQRIEKGKSMADAVWRQKEIEEQALVSRYIINCFKTIRLRDFEEEGPKTVQAGELLHLKTEFKVDINQVGFPDLLSKMVELLDPTSAVCGMPKEAALNFIEENENLKRELFAGFTGPVNFFHETNLYVNIRCAKLYKEGALLFAGAGITAESIAEKEFYETELKMEALGSFFQ